MMHVNVNFLRNQNRVLPNIKKVAQTKIFKTFFLIKNFFVQLKAIKMLMQMLSL